MPSSPHSRDRDYGALSQDEAGGTENATENSKKKRTFAVPPVSSINEKITNSIQKKIPLPSFLWHQHSVLGMTVPDDEVVPPIATGPCCEVDPTGLTRRRRMFLFFLVFFVSTTLAVQVSLGHHGSFYALNAMILIVLPLVCHLKENLPTYSKWFMSRGIGPFGKWPGGRDGFRIEELALIALYALAILKLWKDQHAIGVHVLDNVLWVWFGSIVAEMACLVFKYYFGKYCCCCFSCCVPTTYSLLHADENEGGEDDDAQYKKWGA